MLMSDIYGVLVDELVVAYGGYGVRSVLQKGFGGGPITSLRGGHQPPRLMINLPRSVA